MELTSFSLDEFDELSSWFSDDKSVGLWAGPEYRYPLTKNDIQRMLFEPSGQRPSRFAWTAKIKNSIAGHSQLCFNWENGSALLCRVAVSPTLRGMGYAKPLVSLTLQNAFRHRNIQEVELNVFTFNIAAIAVYRSFGFLNLGTLKPPVGIGIDRWQTYTMRLPRSEWIQPD
ncbi:MAG: GNAT family N-acetyltransferase [Nitrospirales bacterium]